MVYSLRGRGGICWRQEHTAAQQSGSKIHPDWGEFKELTALHFAAFFFNSERASALLRKGADANAIDANGHNLSTWCAELAIM